MILPNKVFVMNVILSVHYSHFLSTCWPQNSADLAGNLSLARPALSLSWTSITYNSYVFLLFLTPLSFCLHALFTQTASPGLHYHTPTADWPDTLLLVLPFSPHLVQKTQPLHTGNQALERDSKGTGRKKVNSMHYIKTLTLLLFAK